MIRNPTDKHDNKKIWDRIMVTYQEKAERLTFRKKWSGKLRFDDWVKSTVSEVHRIWQSDRFQLFIKQNSKKLCFNHDRRFQNLAKSHDLKIQVFSREVDRDSSKSRVLKFIIQ